MHSAQGMIGGAVGLVVGVGLCVLSGAAPAPSPVLAPVPVTPRYTVLMAVPALIVTDNVANKLYVYENTREKSVLRSTVDLTLVGQPDLTAPEAGGGDK
ncbi:MAG TPA: hypothetical protein VGM98_25875 [Schlesneria sp.]|jgi:hypothetical protein